MIVLRFAALLALTQAALLGCSASLPTKYYVLAAAESKAADVQLRTRIVGLGPLEIPEYLDRKSIVTRVREYELRVSDLHRWAEPLTGAIERVLMHEMMARNDQLDILPYPFEGQNSAESRVSVAIDKFESVDEKRIVLTAHLRLLPVGEERARRESFEMIEVPCESADYAMIVRCMNSALLQLAERILFLVE